MSTLEKRQLFKRHLKKMIRDWAAEDTIGLNLEEMRELLATAVEELGDDSPTCESLYSHAN